MAFNPQLTQEVTPVQSFAAPSSAGAMLNVLNFAAGGAGQKQPAGAAPSKSSLDTSWEEFTQTRNGLFLTDAEGNPTPIRIGDAPMGAILEFERLYPSLSKEARDTFKLQNESLDPTTKSVEEARIAAIAKDAVEKDMAWSSSLDFVTAASNAETLFKDDPAKQEAYIEKARQEYDIAQRLIAKNAETLAGEKASAEASDLLWRDTSKSLQPRISFTTQALVGMLEQFQRSPDSSVNLLEVAPEIVQLMPELAGFEKITRDNFQYFAEQLKVSSINLFKRDLEGQGVFVTDPPKEWVSSNFAVMDNLISDAGTDLSNEALAKRYAAGGMLRVEQAAEITGNSIELTIGRMLGGTQGEMIIRSITTEMQNTISKEATATTESHYEAARNASVKENEATRNLWLAAITGKYPELKEETPSGLTGAGDAIFGFSANQLAKVENGGVSSLTPNVYNTLYVPYSQLINEKAETDPVFKDVIFRTLKLDIGRDVDTLRRLASENGISFTLGPNNSLIFGRTPTPVPFVGGPLGSGGAVTTPEAENQKQLDIFQSSNKDLITQITGKTTALGAMGLFGTSVLTGLIDTAPSREKKTKTSDPALSFELPEEVANDKEFLTQVQKVSQDFGFDPNDLLRVIEFETAKSWSPSIKNPNSTATGLIQFLESTAKSLGTSTSELAKMSRADQMPFVAKYLAPYKGKLKNFGDIYMAVHWPAGVGKSETYVMYEKGSKEYSANKNLDTNGDGTITRGETIASVIARTGNGKMTTPSTQETQTFTEEAATNVSSVLPAATTVSAAPTPASTVAPAPAREGSQPETEAAMPAPTEEPTQQARATSAAPAVSQEGQALLANIGAEVDKTYRTAEEFQAATVAGELEAGDIISVNGELYFIRKDGTPQKVGG